jgi:hypothetical protein
MGELWLVVKDVQNNNQSAENKNGCQQKPLPHPVLYGDAIHDVSRGNQSHRQPTPALAWKTSGKLKACADSARR